MVLVIDYKGIVVTLGLRYSSLRPHWARINRVVPCKISFTTRSLSLLTVGIELHPVAMHNGHFTVKAARMGKHRTRHRDDDSDKYDELQHSMQESYKTVTTVTTNKMTMATSTIGGDSLEDDCNAQLDDENAANDDDYIYDCDDGHDETPTT